MENVSTAIILDTRRLLKDKTYPVKLRLTYNRQQKYYPLNKSLTEADFARVYGDKPRAEFKTMLMAFNAVEQRARAIIEKMAVFTFEAFGTRFLNFSKRDDVFAAFGTQVEKLESEGRAGTASSYECALKSLTTFEKSKQLPFSNVSPEYLKSYEKWMLSNGKSLTTVGIYLRAFRALYNEAIAAGDVNGELYPFGKRKYVIPAGRNVKKAISISSIEKLFNYVPVSDNEAKARDLWVFSYLCNGINMKDIARLKYNNIDGDKIIFIRAKTQRTSRKNLKPIVALITAEVKDIVERWGVKPVGPEAYVFPILDHGCTAKEELVKVRGLTKTVNTYMKRIAAKVGLTENISTYTARHSFSTILKRSGTPIELISEALGHNDMATTENYLDSFEDDVKRQYTAQLTAFKK